MRLFAALLALFAGACAFLEEKPQPEAVLDHFFCHTVTRKFTDPPDVILKDQFPLEEKTITVGDRLLLCNPVEKTFKGRKVERKHPEAHLVCYLIAADPYDRKVTIENQLHNKPMQFHVEAAFLLCLPSGKSETKVPPSIPRGLDHFKCYTPKSSPNLNIPVHLHDQFIDQDFTAIRLSLLCNPVEKTVVPQKKKPDLETTFRREAIDDKKREPKVLHKYAHLVCYLLAPLVDFQKPVTIANQFEPAEPIEAKGTQLLCVPSLKND